MSPKKSKLVVLVIMDGWGIAPDSRGNGVSRAKTPIVDSLVKAYPIMTLQASGEAVGLSWGDMGNSEVGHTNLGAGRIIYQTLPRINRAVSDGTFQDNKAFAKALAHVKKNNSKLHLLGLVSKGGVHSHQDHLVTLLEMCAEQKVKNVFVHAFLDGRDTKRDGGLEFVEEVEGAMKKLKVGKIATLAGRFYAMDRDKRWNRTELAYNAIVHGHATTYEKDAAKAIKNSYKAKVFDEAFKPVVIGSKDSPTATVDDKDAIIFFNFRADRARQMTSAFILPSFDKFPETKKYHHLEYVTMTQYQKDLPVEVAFPPESIEQPIGEIIDDAGLKQLHAAETEKYAHVTYFFNGGREKAFRKEDRILIPSPSVSTYDQKPEMSAEKLNDEVIKAITGKSHQFVIINYANPDMVGHSGSISATVKACEIVDLAVGKLIKTILRQDGIALVTADHGNAEELINLQTGSIDKEHSTNPVPFAIVGNDWEGKQAGTEVDIEGGDLSILTPSGMLADVAPTILELLGVHKPKVMTGRSLLGFVG